MTTSELKQYIDRVLGNSIRCLLPSVWWRKLFNLTVDEITAVQSNVRKLSLTAKDLSSNKADLETYESLPDDTTEVVLPEDKSVGYTILGSASDAKELRITAGYAANSTGRTYTRQVVIFTGRTSLVLNKNVYWSNDTEPNIDLNALDEKKYYCFELLTFPHTERDGNIIIGMSTAIASLRKCTTDRFSYDETITDTSVGAPQTKAVKDYVDKQIASIEPFEGVKSMLYYPSDDILTADEIAHNKAILTAVGNKEINAKDIIVGQKRIVSGQTTYQSVSVDKITNIGLLEAYGLVIYCTLYDDLLTPSTYMSRIEFRPDGEIATSVWDIDTEMSDTSVKAVQNKAIKAYVDTQIAQSITTTLNTAV